MLETFEIVAKACADSNRIRILKVLEAGELCVCQIVAALHAATSTVSKQLTELKKAGLVQQRRQGKWVYYRLADKPLNDYAPSMLAVLQSHLNDDATIISDRQSLAKILTIPLSVCCTETEKE